MKYKAKKINIAKILTVLWLLVLSTAGCIYPQEKSPEVIKAKNMRIGVVTKAMDSQFWYDVRSGLEDEANRQDVEVLIMHPEKEVDVAQQERIISDLIDTDIDVLFIAPCDSANTKGYIKKARDKGILVFSIDTRCMDIEVPFIGSDNKKIGEMAADFLIDKMEGQGNIVIISGSNQQTSHIYRVKGFQEKIARHPRMNIVDIYYADSSFALALEISNKIKTDERDIDSVFCTSGEMGLGYLASYTKTEKNKKRELILVDVQDDIIARIKSGEINAMITQDGYEMGRTAIQKAILSMNSATEMEANIYIENQLITRQNIEEFENQRRKEKTGIND